MEQKGQEMTQLHKMLLNWKYILKSKQKNYYVNIVHYDLATNTTSDKCYHCYMSAEALLQANAISRDNMPVLCS